jgi:hypothetical protein
MEGVRFLAIALVVASLALAQDSKTAARDKKADSKGASDASAGRGGGKPDPNRQITTKSGHKVTMDDKKDNERTSKDAASGQKSSR